MDRIFAENVAWAQEVEEAMLEIEGVVDVHCLHVWALTSGKYLASAHVQVLLRLICWCFGCVPRIPIFRSRRDMNHEKYPQDTGESS